MYISCCCFVYCIGLCSNCVWAADITDKTSKSCDDAANAWHHIELQAGSEIRSLRTIATGCNLGMSNDNDRHEKDVASNLDDILSKTHLWDKIDQCLDTYVNDNLPIIASSQHDDYLEEMTIGVALLARANMQSAIDTNNSEKYFLNLRRALMICGIMMRQNSIDGQSYVSGALAPVLMTVYRHIENKCVCMPNDKSFKDVWIMLDKDLDASEISKRMQKKILDTIDDQDKDMGWDEKKKVHLRCFTNAYFEKFNAWIRNGMHCSQDNEYLKTILLLEKDVPNELRYVFPLPLDLFVRLQSLVVIGRGIMLLESINNYKKTCDCFPDSLQNLVKGDKRLQLIDPFSGQVFMYKKTDNKNYVLYSIGPDGMDDGGKCVVVPSFAGGCEYVGDLVIH
jgi:hypothetical protein